MNQLLNNQFNVLLSFESEFKLNIAECVHSSGKLTPFSLWLLCRLLGLYLLSYYCTLLVFLLFIFFIIFFFFSLITILIYFCTFSPRYSVVFFFFMFSFTFFFYSSLSMLYASLTSSFFLVLGSAITWFYGNQISIAINRVRAFKPAT